MRLRRFAAAFPIPPIISVRAPAPGALLLVALAGMLSVPVARSDERDIPTTASPPVTFERRDAMETAAADTSLPPWQREIMLTVARGTSQHGVALSRDADNFSQRRIGAASADGKWVSIPPPERTGHTAIYDPVRDRMIVFGGFDYHNDVWVLKLAGGPTWSALTPSGSPPPGLNGHTAIYDPVRDRMLVFGGSDGSNRFNDVWALTLAGSPVWSALVPSGSPPPGLNDHTAIYDAIRDRMVVFGGFGDDGRRDEVWALTLAGSPAWSGITPSGSLPSARASHAAIYDPVRDRMVMFGGSVANIGSSSNEAWALTLSESPAWSALAPWGSPPPGLAGHTAIYDPARDAMVVFGGLDSTGYRNVA